MAILDDARVQKNRLKLTPLSPKVLQELHDIELDAMARFSGMADELESALGFLRLGYQLGWKPLAIIHSRRTFQKYEKILGIDARSLFPEETAASDRSSGYRVARTMSNFWKAVTGDSKVENRREIDSL